MHPCLQLSKLGLDENIEEEDHRFLPKDQNFESILRKLGQNPKKPWFPIISHYKHYNDLYSISKP